MKSLNLEARVLLDLIDRNFALVVASLPIEQQRCVTVSCEMPWSSKQLSQAGIKAECRESTRNSQCVLLSLARPQFLASRSFHSLGFNSLSNESIAADRLQVESIRQAVLGATWPQAQSRRNAIKVVQLSGQSRQLCCEKRLVEQRELRRNNDKTNKSNQTESANWNWERSEDQFASSRLRIQSRDFA